MLRAAQGELVGQAAGSIHLGWHYAVDGYISIIAIWALWRLTGWWLDRPRVKAFLFSAVRA